MPLTVLKEIFGFDSFRPGQEEVIRAVLDGRDTLAVMPTGGGKSLCYQVPALMGEGLTVIVSPLISLMKDQVDSLLQSSVKGAATLHSGLDAEERWEVEKKIRTGEIRLLYVAPERLRSLEFVLALRRAGVSLFVVDEAHCISEWGHDFRPDYLFLPRVVRDLGSPPVLALTATATPRVRQDILRSLRMREPEVVVTSFNRPNLTYRVLSAKEKKDKLPLILKVILNSLPPGIVYGTTRKECEELAASLKRAGVDAAHYHAGMDAAERSSVQERFMTDELDVVVATIAFGMGIDKPNVRFVIHASVPGSLPAYIQEAGRAGRDGEESECVILYRGADLGRRKRLVTLNAAGANEAESFFRALCQVSNEGRVNLPPASLGALGGVEADLAGVLLGGLEETGLVSQGCGPSPPRPPSSSLWRMRSWRPCPAAFLSTSGSKRRVSTREAGGLWPPVSRAEPGRPTTRSGASRPTPPSKPAAGNTFFGISATHRRSPPAPAAMCASERLIRP